MLEKRLNPTKTDCATAFVNFIENSKDKNIGEKITINIIN